MCPAVVTDRYVKSAEYDVSSENYSMWNTYYKFHICKVSHLCESAYVFWANTAGKKTCYKLDIWKVFHQCEFFDVVWDRYGERKIFYKVHIWKAFH